jgi:4-amino-4-deoxy-L-arabinose transferase-like glycosyltransferase
LILLKKYIFVFLLALAARLLFGAAFYGLERPAVDDGGHYREIAAYLSDGLGFADRHGPTSFRPPLYPAFLALVSGAAGPGLTTARLAQCLLGSAACLLLYAFAARYFGERAGFLSGLVSACYPLLVYLPCRFLSENLMVFLLPAGLILLHAGARDPSWSKSAAAGMVFGLAALTRPMMLAAPIFLLPWFFLGRPRWPLRHTTGFFLVFMLTVLPWTARNYALYEQLVPVTTNGGHTFWGANSPWAQGGWKIPPAVWQGEPVLSYDISKRADLAEDIRQDRRFLIEGARWIRENPGRFLGLLPKKLYRFWHFRQQSETEEVSSRLMDAASLLSYGPVLVFMLAGFFAAFRLWPVTLPLYLIYLLFTVNTLVFYGDLRMRAPLEPLIIAFASYGLIRTWDRFKPGRKEGEA